MDMLQKCVFYRNTRAQPLDIPWRSMYSTLLYSTVHRPVLSYRHTSKYPGT